MSHRDGRAPLPPGDGVDDKPVAPEEDVEFVSVQVMGLRFIFRVGTGSQSFRWLAVAAVQRAASLKRVHGRQRQRESASASPLHPPAVALHAGEAEAAGGGFADTTRSFCCNPPPTLRLSAVLRRGWCVWVETEPGADQALEQHYGAGAAQGLVVSLEQQARLLGGWGLASWPGSRRSASYVAAPSAWHFATFQSPSLPKLSSMPIRVSISPDPITREPRTEEREFRTWLRTGTDSSSLESRMDELWAATTIASVFGREAKHDQDRGRDLVAAALPALDMAFPKVASLRAEAKGMVHMDDLTQLLGSAQLVGETLSVSDVASEVRVANRQRVQRLPENSRTSAAKSVTFPEFVEALVRAAASTAPKGSKAIFESFESAWTKLLVPTLGRVGRDDCGFRKALFTECRPVLDAWAPQLGEAFLRFAPRPEEDRNFVRTCPRWDFATFASFARAAQFEHLGIPVEEDSFLLQTVYGHARQGPVTADGRLIADEELAHGSMYLFDLVEALARLAAMCLRGSAPSLQDAIETVLSRAAAAEPLPVAGK